MVTLGWKSLTEKPGGIGQGRTLSAPIEHQGVRNALRGAFKDPMDDLPEDMRRLLDKMH